MRRIGLAVCAVAVAAALVSCGAAEDGADSKASDGKASAAEQGHEASTSGKNPPEKDVQVTSCAKDEFGDFPEAKLKITNHSSKTSDYLVSVEFLDADGTRKAEGTGLVSNLAPGQTAEDTAGGLAEVPGKVTCRIVKVTRTASL